MSILFRIKENKLYIECFNSGQGIGNFKDILKSRNNGKYYLPSITSILSDNIDKDKDIINKIRGILSIPLLYNDTIFSHSFM